MSAECEVGLEWADGGVRELLKESPLETHAYSSRVTVRPQAKA